METNKKADLDSLRMQASERIFKILGKAPVITIQYSQKYAFAQAMCSNGKTKTVKVEYKELDKEKKPKSRTGISEDLFIIKKKGGC